MIFKQVAIALDQLCNALVGGYADETLSARAWRKQSYPVWGTARKVIDKLFFWQQAHCFQSWVSEIQRKQLPKDYQQ